MTLQYRDVLLSKIPCVAAEVLGKREPLEMVYDLNSVLAHFEPDSELQQQVRAGLLYGQCQVKNDTDIDIVQHTDPELISHRITELWCQRGKSDNAVVYVYIFARIEFTGPRQDTLKDVRVLSGLFRWRLIQRHISTNFCQVVKFITWDFLGSDALI